jgi:RNA polymerase sigma factor (sigma-70 family)
VAFSRFGVGVSICTTSLCIGRGCGVPRFDGYARRTIVIERSAFFPAMNPNITVGSCRSPRQRRPRFFRCEQERGIRVLDLRHDGQYRCQIRWRVTPHERSALARSADEPEAFVEFYDAHAAQTLSYLVSRTGVAQIALDLTAEAFAKAYEARGSFRGATDAEAAAWLRAIVNNELVSFWRREKVDAGARERLAVGTPQIVADDSVGVIERLAGDTSTEPLAHALADLPPSQREAVIARVVDEFDYGAIAAAADVSEEVIRARASRGLRALARDARLLKWRSEHAE